MKSKLWWQPGRAPCTFPLYFYFLEFYCNGLTQCADLPVGPGQREHCPSAVWVSQDGGFFHMNPYYYYYEIVLYICRGIYFALKSSPPPSRKSNFPPIFIPHFWSVHTSPRENFRKFYEKDRNTAYHYNSYSKLTIRAKRRNVFNIYDEIGGKNPEIEKWGNKLWL